MSISSLDLINQTTLVPNTLLGYSSNNVSAIEILPTSITIAGNLNTPTPVYVGISASTGLTTTLSTGLDVNCDFNMNSNDITNLDTLSSTTGSPMTLSADAELYLNSANGAVISMNSADNTQISCGENLFVNTNPITGIVSFTTGDLANSGVVRWNSYPMGITFFNKWNGGFGYNNAGNWEMVKQNTITFPTQFLYGTWAVSFSINCSSVGSAPADKRLAMYFNFIDGNSTQFDGFSYNQNFPFANWFNASTYTNTSQTPLSITYTDYFDFTGAINPLQLQINWFADNPQNQNDFFVSTTFTLMTLI